MVIALGERDIATCFRLACPVAELDWIEGWRFDLIYSESGRNEKHNIFLEPTTGAVVLRCVGAHTYWYTTVFDTDRHRFHAILLTRDLVVAKWELEMQALEHGGCLVDLRVTYVALREEGNRLIAERGFEERIRSMQALLFVSAKTYVETGRMYHVPVWRKLVLGASLLAASIGRHLRSTPRDLASDDSRAR
jgi:hypothetical protein